MNIEQKLKEFEEFKEHLENKSLQYALQDLDVIDLLKIIDFIGFLMKNKIWEKPIWKKSINDCMYPEDNSNDFSFANDMELSNYQQLEVKTNVFYKELLKLKEQIKKQKEEIDKITKNLETK